MTAVPDRGPPPTSGSEEMRRRAARRAEGPRPTRVEPKGPRGRGCRPSRIGGRWEAPRRLAAYVDEGAGDPDRGRRLTAG